MAFESLTEACLEKGGQRLRCGYTTGTCAAAAAKAAAMMLRTGEEVPEVRIVTPGGPGLRLEVEDIRISPGGGLGAPGAVSCAVRKDSGDDPDVTNGVLVRARVAASDRPGIRIDGGEGVGRVTRPGLDQPVGAAAINSTPRRMIEEAVREAAGPSWPGLDVVISVPEGRALAARTFNPKLGIEGGISILGTSGIVEPMSDRALLDTIRAEISVRRAEGLPVLAAAPGNYGKAFFHERYGFSLDAAVTSSNFVCDTVRMAAEAGFSRMLFVGHIGKLVKVAGGVRNTHSRYGDRRMEILAEIAEEVLRRRFPAPDRRQLRELLLSCVAADEAVRILRERGLDGAVLPEMTRRIQRVMQGWAGGRMQVEAVVFSKVYGELGRTKQALAFMRELGGDR